MYGDNPIRKPLKSDGDSLEVKEIFSTIQGEGLHVGVAAVFIRLGGCNLACKFCDTDFEEFSNLTLDEIISEIKVQALDDNGVRVRNWVIITGGEPFRQPIEKFCDRLIDEGFKVQIETNGTLYREINHKVEIICSPKNTGTGYHQIRPDLLARVTAFKFIIAANNDFYSGVPDIGQYDYNAEIFIQPMDEKNEQKNAANLEYTKNLAINKGYRLSLQIHKILNIR